MVSLKNENTIEQPAVEQAPSKSVAKAPNRIAINENEWQILGAWLEQVNKASQGFLILTKADIAGFLIRNHTKELSKKEIQQIRMDNYDPIRHMQWIAPQLKAALQSGDHQKVLILQEELKQVEISIVDKVSRGESTISETAAKRKYKQRKKQLNQDQIAANNTDGIQELQSEIPEG